MFFDIEEELKKLPSKPGVYIMHDENDTIIYVGKAIILKNRVRQYFQSNRNMTSKIQQMVSKIKYFEYIITDSELEALVLECNLIKEHRPKYNTMLKDDKTYPFIKVTVGEAYPRVLITRERGKDKSKYFGPYTNGKAVKDTIELIRKIYFTRTCNRNLPKDIGKERPCLYYHIHQCKAPCQGYISQEEYRKSIQEVIEFLNGNYSKVANGLEEKMKEAAINLDYEEAANYRDLLQSVRQISEKQKITSSDVEDRDILALATAGGEAVVQVFFMRNGKLIGREHFYLTGVEHESRSDIMTSFVKQFYSGTPYVPKELILGDEINEREILEELLTQKRGQKVYIKVPQKGEKERLVELARKNASLVLQQDSEKIKREEARTIGALKELSDMLDIPVLQRIESFDISNTSGFESVGSMVVYEKGKPKRNDYRKFKIKWVKGADDYASMQEVLIRRFTHDNKELREKVLKQIQGKELLQSVVKSPSNEVEGYEEDDAHIRYDIVAENGELVLDNTAPITDYDSFNRHPDLILMDGGRGQVNIALKVLELLKLNIRVCGMVKDDNHRTRGLYYNNVEIPIDKGGEAFKLITRIQDETHRFAIEYHRSLRGKTQVKSILDDIDGIGTTRRRALMKHYASIELIKEASVEELSQVESMNYLSAQKVYEFFHKQKTLEIEE